MKLISKTMHLNRQKGKVVTQITLENDFNISDRKPDIGEIVTENHFIKIDTIKLAGKKADINGRLAVQVLYISADEGQMVCNMDVDIPFAEPVNMDMLEDGDTVKADYEIDNVKVSIINSRKISVKALVTFTMEAESIYDMDVAIEPENTDDAEYIKKQLKIMQIVMKKRDVFRIKEEIELSGGKPNIKEILWRNVDIRNCQTKLMEDKISLNGELVIFLIYMPEEEGMHAQWMDTVINFSGVIDAEGCNEDMIQDIMITPAEINIDIKPDYDGEQRIFEVDAVLNLDMRIYDEDSVDILEDIYSPTVDLVADKKIAGGESFVMKNVSKCRVNDRINVDEDKGRIMQICNTSGRVCIDSVTPAEDGINVDGVVEVKNIYISGSDNTPFCSADAVIPFSHKAEVKGMNNEMLYDVNGKLEQLSSVMTSENEIEIKAVVSMNVTVCNRVEEPVIVNIEEREPDIDKIKNMPGMVIYNVNPGDNLWSIAKNFHTTVDSIKEINGLHSDKVNSGENIIIIKSM
ncbi:MAG: DUF3794 domain-containing protein [Lachnospiraceae bacterium]|nr:DUF3794 domain-containing protein [Lachnospiraceae bacterium]